MIDFVNAKINIGLQIVNRRDDGYHDLQTIFYPVGKYAGMPANPTPFCDILEIVPVDPAVTPNGKFAVSFSGRPVLCELEKNLVWRAADIFFSHIVNPDSGFAVNIQLEKYLPDGAGMGGGSADAAFTLRMLREMYGEGNDDKLAALALKLGADCPFFIYNTPRYAEGVGEKLMPINISLEGYYLVVVKPNIDISTREAFAGVTPKPAQFDLRRLPELPLNQWRNFVHNDFEDSIFPNHPEMRLLKEQLYAEGAQYASLTGSGSCIYGIFENEKSAAHANAQFLNNPTLQASYLLKL